MKAVIKICAFCVMFVLTSLTLASAQEKTPPPSNEKSVAEKVSSAASTEKNTADEPNPYKNQKSDKYQIGFQDTIEVKIDRHDDLSRVVNVNPDGTIRLPRIDEPIIAVCKTERELEDTITAQYKNYLKRPFVTVRAVDQRSQPFAVVGAVQKPGNFYLNKRITLLELLALAGGPDVENAGAKIQVARLGNLAGCGSNVGVSEPVDISQAKFVGYNLNEVLKGKENPYLQPGDIVSVLIAEEAYVVGNVKEPKKIVLREAKTLTQALAEAGGITSVANTEKVIIQRQEASGVKKELVFDLKEIRNQKIPDPVLQGNDIVQVSTDKGKSAVKGITDLFKTALPSAIYRF